MFIITNIILTFIGWVLMYFGLCFLDRIADNVDFKFWYIKPEKWLKKAGLYWILTFIFVSLFV